MAAAEKLRIQRRATRYKHSPADENQTQGPLSKDRLLRKLENGSTRVVPPPPEREALVEQVHDLCGHFGRRRTEGILLASYWWPGMRKDVATVVSKCAVCDRVRKQFNRTNPNLNPLIIRGLFYRWGIALCGPFPLSPQFNRYCCVMIEHYSKQVEIVAIPDKEPATIARVFMDRVICQYGCCAEVVCDNGGEFKGEFAELLSHHFIDQRCTSANHPQANGLSERVVQTLKRSIRKYTETHLADCHWDDALPYILLGYRCSKQKSINLSPYEILHGVAPTVPPAIMERMSEVIDFDDPECAAINVLACRQVLKDQCIIAGDNLLIAQQRDCLRYSQKRTGSYSPRLFNITAGCFVYLKRDTPNTAHMAARPEIYRVVELRANGVVQLDGRCGTKFAVHLTNVAPCHLPNIDPAQDFRLARPHSDLPCSVCRSPETANEMCDKAFHLACLKPPLEVVPEEEVWLFKACKAAGVHPQAIGNMPAPSDPPYPKYVPVGAQMPASTQQRWQADL